MTEWVRLPKVTKTATLEGWRNRPCEEGGGEPGPPAPSQHPDLSAAQLPGLPKGQVWGRRGAPLPPAGEGHGCGPPRFADQHGARAAFTLSFLASSALYLLLAAACIPALPGVALLFASRLPGALMHTLPGRAPSATCPSCRGPGLDWRGRGAGRGLGVGVA